MINYWYRDGLRTRRILCSPVSPDSDAAFFYKKK
jgi:hypothetical protein